MTNLETASLRHWRPLTYGVEAYCMYGGKIIGEVRKGYNRWEAIARGSAIGEYVSKHEAQAAVEVACTRP